MLDESFNVASQLEGRRPEKIHKNDSLKKKTKRRTKTYKSMLCLDNCLRLITTKGLKQFQVDHCEDGLDESTAGTHMLLKYPHTKRANIQIQKLTYNRDLLYVLSQNGDVNRITTAESVHIHMRVRTYIWSGS